MTIVQIDSEQAGGESLCRAFQKECAYDLPRERPVSGRVGGRIEGELEKERDSDGFQLQVMVSFEPRADEDAASHESRDICLMVWQGAEVHAVEREARRDSS